MADVKGTVTDEEGQPIVGANLIWKNTGVGATTDLDGNFVLPVSPLTDTLIVSYVSYENDTLIAKDGDILTVQMGGTVALSELDVAARKVALSKSRTAVFDVQTISGEELCKAACCNLSESFETNPSVDVAYSDAATGAKQIKLLGLSGQYVQIMTENIPNFRGLSAPFGLGYVPGPWMESIQVSKGTSSVLNGYEALIYFYQARHCGRFIWVDRVLTADDEFNLPLTKDMKESYTYVMQDVNDAIVGLPETAEAGRFTKNAARVLKSDTVTRR